MRQDRIDLVEEQIPKEWYNILPDLPDQIPPYKDIKTGKEMRRLPDAFTKTASKLEFSEERWIKIPEAVLMSYTRFGRPTPLIRAHHLEEFLKTPARIYYKCEDLPPGGTFKINTAIPQAYWAMNEGYKRTIIAGTSGTRTKFLHAFAARIFGLTPTVFMTRAECEQNRDQVFFLKTMLEADLWKSPSSRSDIGRRLLKVNPNHPGSSVIRDQEIAEEAARSKDAAAVMSSFLNHVLMTETIIGLEIKKQLEAAAEQPNVLVASVGAGSHLFGLIAPFARDRLKNKQQNVKFLAVESETSAKLAGGTYDYVPLQGPLESVSAKISSIEWKTPPNPIAGMGIQVKTAAPLLSLLNAMGYIETRVYPGDEKAIRAAGQVFLQTEGRLLAPESAYAISAVINEALEAKKRNRKAVIVASVSGTSYLDFGEKGRYAGLASMLSS
jgi:tryptophan synthase beta chain